MRARAAAALLLLCAAPAPAQEVPAWLDSAMVRDAAGTAWQPDATPMGGYHGTAGAWRLMAHGAASLGYMSEETPKGGSGFGSTNWAMFRAARPWAMGNLVLTAMVSAETLTLGECGAPRLLATGPGCPTHFIGEFQHPHPPFMELSASHGLALSRALRFQGFVALVGEPALGPPAYMHRASGMLDPVAPISHHELNPAHASRGVLTAAVASRRWKAEGSVFSGKTADPDRLFPDPAPLSGLTSRSARLSFNPSPAWALQLSGARIAAEAGHHQGSEGGHIRSAVASAMHQRALGAASALSATAAWARMDDGTEPRDAFLLEGALSLRGAHTLFARAEHAGRNDVRVTIIDHPDGTHEHLTDVSPMHVAQLSGGYALSRRLGSMAVALGARGSVSFLPATLLPTYEERRPLGFALFLSLLPAPAPAGEPEHQH